MNNDMNEEQPCSIAGWGIYLPEERQTVEDVAKQLSTPLKVLTSNFAMIDKPIEPTLHPSEMGARALETALGKTGVAATELDLVVFANSGLNNYLMWSAAAHVCHLTGATNAGAIDLSHSCNSVLTALDMVRNRMQTDERVNTVAIVCAERSSALFHEPGPRLLSMCLYADGAAAIVVKRGEEGLRVRSHSLRTEAALHGAMIYPWGGTHYWLEQWPEEVHERGHARRMVELLETKDRALFKEVADDALQRSGLTHENVRYCLLNHDREELTSIRLENLGFRKDQSFFAHEHIGHIGGADHFIALDHLTQERPLQVGDGVLLCAVSAGQNWAALVLEKTTLDKA